MTKSLLAIGLMSGTSMDGVDVALLQSDGESQLDTIASSELAYSPECQLLLKAAEYAVHQSHGDLRQAELNFNGYLSEYLQTHAIKKPGQLAKAIASLQCYLSQVLHDRKHITDSDANSDITAISLANIIHLSTRYHIRAVADLLAERQLEPHQIDVIGYHGQTLYHHPRQGVTLQIGHADVMAKTFACPVIFDFRTNDIQHGGQGAPFAPIYHQALARREQQQQTMQYPIVVINCGGIANVTVINGPAAEQLLGFDTGPGNALLDRFVRAKTAGQQLMDQHGHYGSVGNVHHEVVELLQHYSCVIAGRNYYQLSPPKSLDINDLSLLPELMALSLEDGCATLAMFSVKTVIEGLQLAGIQQVHQFILAGGGWHNAAIYQQFCHAAEVTYPHARLNKATELGWDGNALEAEVFAYLAIRSLKQLPLSYPSTTGVSQPVTGGIRFNP